MDERIQALRKEVDRVNREILRLLSDVTLRMIEGQVTRLEREIDAILGDCHYFARKAWDDTS